MLQENQNQNKKEGTVAEEKIQPQMQFRDIHFRLQKDLGEFGQKDRNECQKEGIRSIIQVRVVGP